jgi:hypothetical protein
MIICVFITFIESCHNNLDNYYDKTRQDVLCGQVYRGVSQTFLLADPFWLQNITTDPHILAHINIMSK